VADALDVEIELVPIRTSGDEGRGAAAPGDKSRFVKEIEEALLRVDVDLAVHSAKDVPAELPEGLAIVGVPQRADARDAVCGARSLDALAEGARVGTASLRRRAQILARRPDLSVEDLRGNVDTRLRRLGEGRYDAIVLAAAGLERLGRPGEGAPVPTAELVPAAGQGCLALEARADDRRVAELAARVTDRGSLARLTAERTVVQALDATCRTPVAAYAEANADEMRLVAFAGLPDGTVWVRDEVSGPAADPARLGALAAERMLAAGAGEVLARADEAMATKGG
jgi:hydroxymethylbilane synthase